MLLLTASAATACYLLLLLVPSCCVSIGSIVRYWTGTVPRVDATTGYRTVIRTHPLNPIAAG